MVRRTRDNQAVVCAECKKSRPRSAFPKAELAASSGARCRTCVQGMLCSGCNQLLPIGTFDEAHAHRRAGGGEMLCRTCQDNAQIDRLLQTPKDEVTHFGSHFVFQLQREAEHTLLLACHRYGLSERLLLQKILDFLRVPFIMSQNGMHYCELCDDTFPEVVQRERVHMAISSEAADWSGCPGARLKFSPKMSFKVAELRKVPSGEWFFRTQIPQRTAEQISEDLDHGEVLTHFQTRWAPMSATLESREPSALSQHHQSPRHRFLEESVSSGRSCLLNRAALGLARRLNERPSMTLSRLRDGLGLNTRFCCPEDVHRASMLERVRDLDIPLRTVRDALCKGGRERQLLWITRPELLVVEDLYQSQAKGVRKKGSQRNR